MDWVVKEELWWDILIILSTPIVILVFGTLIIGKSPAPDEYGTVIVSGLMLGVSIVIFIKQKRARKNS